MSRQKILFLVVLGVVGLFIASIVASMFPAKQTLPNGYQILVTDKGETWVRSPDRQALVTDVSSVWFGDGRLVVERHAIDDKPPFKLADCDYRIVDGKGALKPISKAEARALVAGLERKTGSDKTCVPLKR